MNLKVSFGQFITSHITSGFQMRVKFLHIIIQMTTLAENMVRFELNLPTEYFL